MAFKASEKYIIQKISKLVEPLVRNKKAETGGGFHEQESQ